MKQSDMVKLIANLQGRITAEELSDAEKSELLARHQSKRYWQKTEIPANDQFCRKMEADERRAQAKAKRQNRGQPRDTETPGLASEIARLKAKLVKMGVDVSKLGL